MSQKVSSWFRKDRTEGLTDGIFATVMTILVLSLVVPAITGPNASATLQADLYGLLPDLFAYIVTFIFLGVLWISHQNMFSHINTVDLRTVWINLVLLPCCLTCSFLHGVAWKKSPAIQQFLHMA